MKLLPKGRLRDAEKLRKKGIGGLKKRTRRNGACLVAEVVISSNYPQETITINI